MGAGGISAVQLDRMRDVMAAYVERGELLGLVALVCRRGELHVDAIGARTSGGEPIARDTIFRIGSMTKPITAAATMLLVEEGRLGLDEPVDRLLPELAGRRALRTLDGPLDDTVPATRPITVRDLLTCRMGFGIIRPTPRDMYPIEEATHRLRLGLGPPNPSMPPEPDEWIRRLGTLPLMGQPGEQWMYDTSYGVLGVLVARASGQPFETFLRERLFEPLGMRDTGFSVPAADVRRLADCYWIDPLSGESVVYDPAEGGQWSRPPDFPSGSTGLVTTIDDYLAFARMLWDGGRHGDRCVLSEPSVAAMTTDHLTSGQKTPPGQLDFLDGSSWGFGVSIVTRADDGVFAPGTYGWDNGLGSVWRSDPARELITILMTQRAWNASSPPDFCLDFWRSAYQTLEV
jgi:CubicO group peptidase (beta-lactamase class C family)